MGCDIMELVSNKLRGSITYMGKAFCIALLIYTAACLLPVERVTSDCTTNFLNSFGVTATSYEKQGRILMENIPISIECTAVKIIAVYVGLILSVKSSNARKFIFSIAYSLTVFLTNSTRIGITYYLRRADVSWVLAHDVLWIGFFIAIGALFFMVSHYYLPRINENLYIILEASLNSLRTKGGKHPFTLQSISAQVTTILRNFKLS